MEFFRRQRPKDDPWANSYSDAYICRFKKEIERLKNELTLRFGALTFQFHRERPRIEFYDARGEVAARVHVEGECCAPCTAKVALGTLPPESRLFFKEAFPTLSVRFA